LIIKRTAPAVVPDDREIDCGAGGFTETELVPLRPLASTDKDNEVPSPIGPAGIVQMSFLVANEVLG